MKRLTMSAPGKNALGLGLMEWILAELRDAGGEPLLITGAGDAFSAGLNLKEVASLDRTGMDRFLSTLEAMVAALFEYPGPTVAWVNGHAIAGGCVVAMCCDHRVATSSPAVRIGLNEVALGLQFPPKTMGMVRRRLSPHAIERVLLEAGLYDPHTALRLGLVDDVSDDAERAATQHLEKLAGYPREAYAATKRTLRAGALDVSADDEARFRDVQIPLWAGPDVKARVAAVLKR